MIWIWLHQAIWGGVMALLALIPLILVLYSVLRGHHDAVLCMDCQQCMANCPVREILRMDYLGPAFILRYARSGSIAKAVSQNLFSCTTCALCTPTCPRGLEVKHSTDLLRAEAAAQGTGQYPAHLRIISMASRYGNVYDSTRDYPSMSSQKPALLRMALDYGSRLKLELPRIKQQLEQPKP